MNRKALVLLGSALLWSSIALASEKGHWGYRGDTGPEHWGSLSEDYALCGSGKAQSPVNITGAEDTDLPAIELSYKETGLDVVNNGHTIKASHEDGSAITVDGATYKLLQVHFHTPSENNVDGHSFPMEAHLVHADDAGNLAVIGVLFSEGKENALVGKIWQSMPAEAGKTAKDTETKIDVSTLLPEDKDYYSFDGSLTTPPCSEGVKWMVLKATAEASAEQIKKFGETMQGDTNRPVQPLNDRKILM